MIRSYRHAGRHRARRGGWLTLRARNAWQYVLDLWREPEHEPVVMVLYGWGEVKTWEPIRT